MSRRAPRTRHRAWLTRLLRSALRGYTSDLTPAKALDLLSQARAPATMRRVRLR
jgi:hypothetical protein